MTSIVSCRWRMRQYGVDYNLDKKLGSLMLITKSGYYDVPENSQYEHLFPSTSNINKK